MIEHYEGLRRHCYRMTGSFSAAATIVAETYSRASDARAAAVGSTPSTRTELYRQATAGALRVIESRDQRQIIIDQLTMIEPTWLEPYPTGPSTVGGPIADVGTGAEPGPPVMLSVSSVIGLQLLPPRQRAALLLHDVAGLPLDEVALALDLRLPGLERLLDGARFTIECHRDDWPEPIEPDELSDLVTTFGAQWLIDDRDGLTRSLAGDVMFLMPPESLTIHGRRGVMAHLSELTGGRLSSFRLVAVELNGRPSYAVYRPDATAPRAAGTTAPRSEMTTAQGAETTAHDAEMTAAQGPETTAHDAEMTAADAGTTAHDAETTSNRSETITTASAFGFFHLDGAGGEITRLTVFGSGLFAPMGLPSTIES